MAVTMNEAEARQRILNHYGVTEQQISKTEMVEQRSPEHRIFFLVKSSCLDNVEYKVSYDHDHGVLRCESWNGGPPCKAAADGMNCWHRKASLAAWEIFKLEQRQQAEAETQAALADPEVQREITLATLEGAERQLRRRVQQDRVNQRRRQRDDYAREAREREERAVARDGARAYESNEFRILR